MVRVQGGEGKRDEGEKDESMCVSKFSSYVRSRKKKICDQLGLVLVGIMPGT